MKYFISITLFTLGLVFFATPAQAAYICKGNAGSTGTPYSTLVECQAACTGSGYSCIQTSTNTNSSGGTPTTLKDPLGLTGGPQQLIGRVIQAALGLVGSLALLMFVYGGLLWMTSGGNDEKVKQGREILIWATAGLALVFFSYVLVRFVIGGLTGQELPGGQQQNGPELDPGGEGG